MKKWSTIEFKGSVNLMWEDEEALDRGNLQLTYIEAWGLLHALENLRDSPAFAVREPSMRNVRSRSTFTTRIEYNGRD